MARTPKETPKLLLRRGWLSRLLTLSTFKLDARGRLLRNAVRKGLTKERELEHFSQGEREIVREGVRMLTNKKFFWKTRAVLTAALIMSSSLAFTQRTAFMNEYRDAVKRELRSAGHYSGSTVRVAMSWFPEKYVGGRTRYVSRLAMGREAAKNYSVSIPNPLRKSARTDALYGLGFGAGVLVARKVAKRKKTAETIRAIKNEHAAGIKKERGSLTRRIGKRLTRRK